MIQRQIYTYICLFNFRAIVPPDSRHHIKKIKMLLLLAWYAWRHDLYCSESYNFDFSFWSMEGVPLELAQVFG